MADRAARGQAGCSRVWSLRQSVGRAVRRGGRKLRQEAAGLGVHDPARRRRAVLRQTYAHVQQADGSSAQQQPDNSREGGSRGGHGKSGSLIRSNALLPRSKLGTRHTQTTCTLPPDNRQNAVVSNRFGGSRPRRSSAPRARRSTWRGDRHPVRCRWRVGASLRLGGGLHGSARRRCADCTTPAPLPHHSHWEWCSSYGTAHRSRAPLPCAIRSGGGPGGVLPLMGAAFPRGPPSHELATPS